MAQSIRTADVCVVDFNTLLQGGDCGTLIEDAFGPNGLGILAVANVPGLEERRQTCLPLAFKVANMDEEAKKKYELGEAYYAFGWSHGKESLQGKPDYSKGSYYNNPRFNQPTEDADLMAKFPTMYHPNIWPQDEVPELEKAFMQLGQLIIDTGLLIASECDKYVQSKCPTYEAGKLHNRITNSRVHCGRLLHYFALDPNQVQKPSTDEVTEADFSNWCGWHNDHSALTGLVQALFTDMQGNTIENPDPNVRISHTLLMLIDVLVGWVVHQEPQRRDCQGCDSERPPCVPNWRDSASHHRRHSASHASCCPWSSSSRCQPRDIGCFHECGA
ncbi:hypothetical protein AC1031_007065 [Aphanomyces cochlioides]|nr:hypothetical protein AC1031_007065 [Aphanomyces cochlioides]